VARIGGIDLPKNKRLVIALTYIYGVGLKVSEKILFNAKLDPSLRVKDLSEDEVVRLRSLISSYEIEGDLRRNVNRNIKRLIDMSSYRGSRHRKKLPCRGQRTHTNARTKRGKKIAIANKKKVTK
jgi:small subunit ribosomal protein S13